MKRTYPQSNFEVTGSVTMKQSVAHLIDNKTKASADILAYGAILNKFSVPHNGDFFNVIDGYDSAEVAVGNVPPFFQGAKLSPYVCRIKNAKYSFEGKEYLTTKYIDRGQALHGLIYDHKYNGMVGGVMKDHAYENLKMTYHGGNPGYPFRYSCDILYTLAAENTLTVQTTITNLHEGPIPMTDGWHPYFTLGDSIDDYEVSFQSKEMLEFDEALIPTGKLIPYTDFVEPKLFGDTHFDNCFTRNMETDKPACTLRNPKNGLQLEVYPDASYPFLQFFTPAHRRSIAIENLSSAPDAFNNGIGLVILQPGEAKIFTTRFVIRSV